MNPSILHLSTTDHEGGAAKAAVRLHRALLADGENSRLLVQNTQDSAPATEGPRGGFQKIMARLVPYLDRLAPAIAGQKPATMFHAAWLPDGLARRVRAEAPSLVHSHWTAQGFLRIETLGRLGRPVVLTLHDMWGLTGGCHVAGACRRFETGCGRCPMLAGRHWDLSHRVVRRKLRSWPLSRMAVIAPSRWMAEEAGKSMALRDADLRVIPNALDLSLFRPIDPRVCRQVLGLDPRADLLVFGAIRALGDPNKGFALLKESLDFLWAGLSAPRRRRLRLAIFGAWPTGKEPPFPFPVDWLGPVRDDRALALAYGAASVVIVPSRVESFGQVASEALACGTPVACFDTTGLKDVVSHRQCGWRAQAFDPRDLARGIAWCLERSVALGRRGRLRAEERFDSRKVARRHMEVYRELTARS